MGLLDTVRSQVEAEHAVAPALKESSLRVNPVGVKSPYEVLCVICKWVHLTVDESRPRELLHDLILQDARAGQWIQEWTALLATVQRNYREQKCIAADEDVIQTEQNAWVEELEVGDERRVARHTGVRFAEALEDANLGHRKSELAAG